jgi:hypothetical protein
VDSETGETLLQLRRLAGVLHQAGGDHHGDAGRVELAFAGQQGAAGFVGLADDHELVGAADIELARRERFEDRRRACLARGRERGDRRLAFAETASGEIGDEGSEVGGESNACQQERSQRRQEHDDRTRVGHDVGLTRRQERGDSKVAPPL